MNEMRKLMEVVEIGEAKASATVNRFVLRHKSGAYISIFNFGGNENIANAKLFISPAEAKFHLTKLPDNYRDEWDIIRVKVTIEE